MYLLTFGVCFGFHGQYFSTGGCSCKADSNWRWRNPCYAFTGIEKTLTSVYLQAIHACTMLLVPTL